MAASPRLCLPFIAPGQAQKELNYNEAMQTIDLLLVAMVEEGPRDLPPDDVAPGQCYLVGDAPSGPWAGRRRCMAGWTSAGWRFVDPPEGMTVFVRSRQAHALFRDGGWEIGQIRGSAVVVGGDQVIGSRGAPLPSPQGGKVVDVEARAAIDAIGAALRTHGLVAG